jgi:hypothetical protein
MTAQSPEVIEAFLRKFRADAVEQGSMSREVAEASDRRAEINRLHRESGVQHSAREVGRGCIRGGGRHP